MGLFSIFGKKLKDQKNIEHVASSSTEWLAQLEAFGGTVGEGRDYFFAHYERYLATLDLIGSGHDDNISILELGASYPFAFTLMLNKIYPKADVFLAQLSEDAETANQLELENQQTHEALNFQLRSFNIERDVWPFETNSFDVIFCMEIIEHLLLDPAHVFREAHRILRPGGEFIVTTPNLACYESLDRLIQLRSPYRFGVYSKHGAYGRHNREFTPDELTLLGESNGFDTAVLNTQDVYPVSCDYSHVRAQFCSDLDRDDLRRQNIFYKGKKANRPFDGYPSELFDFDPGIHRVNITIKSICSKVAENESISGSVRINNTGGYIWHTQGENMTTLRAMLLTNDKRLIARDFRRVDLPQNIAPGEELELDFKFEGHNICGEYFLRFDMVHERVCWFSDIKPNWIDVPLQIHH